MMMIYESSVICLLCLLYGAWWFGVHGKGWWVYVGGGYIGAGFVLSLFGIFVAVAVVVVDLELSTGFVVVVVIHDI